MRIGISISKKFLGAVGRNKQRRQIRSIIQFVSSESLKKPLDVVLILRKPFLELDYKSKHKVIQVALERL